MSEDYSLLLSLLMSRGLNVLGSIVKDSGPQGVIFVRIAVARDSDNKQRPSNRLLSDIEEELRAAGYSVEFLLSDPHGIDMEGGLRATLMHSFGSDVRNVFLSLNERSANVWLEAKRRLDDLALNAIKTRAMLYLVDFSIQLDNFVLTTGENVPSDSVILRTLRQIAPATEVEVKNQLMNRQFDVPSDDWLKRRLDALRKAGKVVWISGGKFACSLTTTRALGTIKGRNSPDIARMLALARKGR